MAVKTTLTRNTIRLSPI